MQFHCKWFSMNAHHPPRNAPFCSMKPWRMNRSASTGFDIRDMYDLSRDVLLSHVGVPSAMVYKRLLPDGLRTQTSAMQPSHIWRPNKITTATAKCDFSDIKCRLSSEELSTEWFGGSSKPLSLQMAARLPAAETCSHIANLLPTICLPNFRRLFFANYKKVSKYLETEIDGRQPQADPCLSGLPHVTASSERQMHPTLLKSILTCTRMSACQVHDNAK